MLHWYTAGAGEEGDLEGVALRRGATDATAPLAAANATAKEMNLLKIIVK